MIDYSRPLSEKIAQKYSDLFQKQHCYENVYHMVTEDIDELNPPSKLSVLFCYRPGKDNRYYRHAFCLYDGMIVEPLLYLDMSEENRSAIIPICFMSVPEYSEMVHMEGNHGLRNYLYPDDLRVVGESGIFRRLGLIDLSSLFRTVETEAYMGEIGEKQES